MNTKPRLLVILDIVTILFFITAVGMVFFYAPLEAVMGQVQRVFYFHVANAWVGVLGFMVVALVYAAYLMLRQGIEDPDRRARFGAVYAVLSFISVPLTFISIRIFRTIHTVNIGSGAAGAEGGF